jgi:hypothetical protein
VQHLIEIRRVVSEMMQCDYAFIYASSARSDLQFTSRRGLLYAAFFILWRHAVIILVYPIYPSLQLCQYGDLAKL